MGNDNCSFLPCKSKTEDVAVPRTPEDVYVPQAIIDNIRPCRLPQADINKFPYNNIGVVLSQHPKNKSSFQGTGFLISKDLVLTCAHNICNIQSGKKKHEFIKFYPSAHGKLNKYHKATIAYIPDEYFIIGCKPLAPFDYALLKLDEPVSQAQFLTIGLNFEDFKTEAPICIFGYPSSEKFQEVKIEDGQKGRYMWQAGLSEQNKIFQDKDSLAQKRILYKISTEGGQSGSPIMIKKGGSFIVIGLHQGGFYIDVDGQRVACNIGRRLTEDLIANIGKWKQICNGSIYECKNFQKSVIQRAPSIREPIDFQNHKAFESTISRQKSYYVSKYWDLTLPSAVGFFIERQTVTRIFFRNQSYYQVVSAQPLPAYYITRFRFDFYGGNQSMILGIVTESNRKRAWSNGLGQGSLGLITNKKLAMGAIFRQGSPIEQWKRSLFIEEGQIVTMEVNKSQGVMSFQRSKTLDKFEFKIGHFAQKEIFTFICMRNKDSAITYLPWK